MKNKNLLFVALVLLLAGCRQVEDIKNLQSPTYDPEVAFPLANATFTIQDMLDRFEGEESYISTVDDGMIAVVYRGHVFSVEGAAVYTFPGIENVPIPPANFDYPYPEVAGAKIKKVIFKSGELVLNINNKPNLFTGDVELNVTFKDLKTGTQGLLVTMDVPRNSGSFPQTLSKTVNLSGKTLDLSDDNISVSYSAKLKSSGATVFFTDELTFSFSNLAYSYLEGKLPNFQFDAIPEDTVNIGMFANAVGGNVSLKDPRLNIIVKSSYGTPVRAKTEVLKAIDVYGFSQDITSTYNGIYDFPFPLTAGASATDTFVFKGTNSNIGTVIAQRPNQIVYKVAAELNPNNLSSGFVTDSSKFDVYVDVALPMWGRTSNLSFEKEFSIDLSTFQAVGDASFKLVTENGFPVDVFTQLYFYDAGNQVLDSLFKSSPKILKSAAVGSDGKVTTWEKQSNEAVFDAAAFARLKQATSLRLSARLNTTNNGNTDVKFYPNYGLRLKLGVKAGVNVVELVK